MPPSSNAVLLLAVSLCLAACSSPPCTLAAAAKGGKPKPLVTAIAKDAATKLYAAPLKGGRTLVLDLSGQTISYTCDPKRPTPPALTTILSANATDGTNPLYPVSFPAAASSCLPASSLVGGKQLPAGAAGVAGLAMSSSAALPAQVSRAQRLPDKFMLCLPRTGAGDGVAIFGGGPLFLTTIAGYPFADDFTSGLTHTPLLSKGGSSSYYITVKDIAVNGAQVKLPGGALAIANGGVVLSTTAPYTALRPDVYRPFVDAFDRALTKQSNSKRVAAVAPFELCYDSSTLPGPTRIGWLVPNIDLMLEGGKNWTFIAGLNTMVDVNSFTAACFAFVEMRPKKGRGGYSEAPAVEIGGFQMENHVLQFDLEKQQLGFTKLQIFTSCSKFNFTLSH